MVRAQTMNKQNNFFELLKKKMVCAQKQWTNKIIIFWTIEKTTKMVCAQTMNKQNGSCTNNEQTK